jgi:2-isopropylmalate synthase
MRVETVPGGDLGGLAALATFVAEIANIAPDAHAPYVGASAFAHKGGVHGAATMRVRESYQHIDPALVGNETHLVVSELGGRANAAWLAERLGHELEGVIEPRALSNLVKRLEADGAAFEGAEASFELLIRRQRPDYRPFFRVVDFSVVVDRRDGASMRAEASAKVEVDGEMLHTAAEGNGPVHAIDRALRKALGAFYPEIDDVHLVDYKVRILDGESATAARTRVVIETSGPSGTWATVGSDTNIIGASVAALTDSFEYGLWKADARPAPRSERSVQLASPQLAHEGVA